MLSRKRTYPFDTLSEDLSMKWKTGVNENSLALQGLLSGGNCTMNRFKNTYPDAVDADCYQRTDGTKLLSNQKLEGMEAQDSFDKRQTNVCDVTMKDCLLSSTSIKSDIKTPIKCIRCQAGEPGHIQHILH